MQGYMQKFCKGGTNLGILKRGGGGGGGAAASRVRGSTGRQCGPPQHIKQNLKHLVK